MDQYTKDSKQHSLYQSAIDNALTYTEYRKLVTDLFTHQRNTGTNHSAEYLNYTRMNIRRMDRLDKKGVLAPESIKVIQSIRTPMTWLTLTEGWCADAAQCLPYIAKMAATNKVINLKLILRDKHPNIMNAHLYKGSLSIPKVILLDTKDTTVLGEWGPRPTPAQAIVDQARADKAQSNDGAIKALIDYEKNKDLQLWYKKDKGVTLQKELIGVLNNMPL